MPRRACLEAARVRWSWCPATLFEDGFREVVAPAFADTALLQEYVFRFRNKPGAQIGLETGGVLGVQRDALEELLSALGITVLKLPGSRGLKTLLAGGMGGLCACALAVPKPSEKKDEWTDFSGRDPHPVRLAQNSTSRPSQLLPSGAAMI